MTNPTQTNSAGLDKAFTNSWRYKIGLGLIIIGHLALLIGLLLPLFGLASKGKGGLIGVFIIGGELISVSSIVFLGKEGFKAIKNKFFGFIGSGYTAPVGQSRHYIGIVLLLTNVITTYIVFIFAWLSFKRITPESPFPSVFGTPFEEQGSFVFTLFLIGEISFILSIYILGADWWERFRQIFVWSKPLADESREERI